MALKLLSLEKGRNKINIYTMYIVRSQFLYGRLEDHLLRKVFSQLHYRRNVVTIVCDKVHTVVHW